jgi:diguanylate cyclase
MTLHDPQLVPHFPERLRRWFGMAVDEPGGGSLGRTDQRIDPAATEREALLGQIAALLDRYRLPATRLSLGVAHDLARGTDPELAGALALRTRLHRPVTLEWLEELTGDADPQEERAALAGLMQRTESSIAAFGLTTHAAHAATSDYGTALATHADALGRKRPADTAADAVIGELAALTASMLTRTREAERELKRSESESRALKRRLDEARRASEQDHLTGLPNRKAFEARFAREYAEARSVGEPLCVAFCDVDRFKDVNDSHGHEAGDRVLKVVAETLARISDDRCHVARHGGEEFVAVFRGLTLDQALVRLDRAREDMAARRLVNRATEEPFGQVTFSGGVADAFAWPDRRDALRAADVALYRAKQAGRNRIEPATGAELD